MHPPVLKMKSELTNKNKILKPIGFDKSKFLFFAGVCLSFFRCGYYRLFLVFFTTVGPGKVLS